MEDIIFLQGFQAKLFPLPTETLTLLSQGSECKDTETVRSQTVLISVLKMSALFILGTVFSTPYQLLPYLLHNFLIPRKCIRRKGEIVAKFCPTEE